MIKTYYLLTKPGIILGNLITTAAGFAMASKGRFDLGLFCAKLAGLGSVIASACVCNNYIDRISDWVAGWACNVDHPNVPVLLEVTAEDRLAGCFMFRLPVWMKPELYSCLRVRRVTDGAELQMTEGCKNELPQPGHPHLRLVA